MADYKNIRVYHSTFKKLSQLQENFGVSKTRILEGATEYFIKTKINPNEEPKDFNAEFKKLKNSLISFVKTQDKNIEINTKKIDALITEFKNVLAQKKSSNISTEEMKILLSNFGKALIEKLDK